MLVPALPLSGNVHEMEKLYVTRVTSARSRPLAMLDRSRFAMSGLPPNVLQNSLPHCDSAIIESDWTVQRIKIARFRLILNQCCARYPLKIVLQQIPPESGHLHHTSARPLRAKSGQFLTLLMRAVILAGWDARAMILDHRFTSRFSERKINMVLQFVVSIS